MTTEVEMLLRARDAAFKSGDEAALKKARAKISRTIKTAKPNHAQKIDDPFRDTNDTRRLWLVIQSITNCRPAPLSCEGDRSLPEALNQFYSRF